MKRIVVMCKLAFLIYYIPFVAIGAWYFLADTMKCIECNGTNVSNIVQFYRNTNEPLIEIDLHQQKNGQWESVEEKSSEVTNSAFHKPSFMHHHLLIFLCHENVYLLFFALAVSFSSLCFVGGDINIGPCHGYYYIGFFAYNSRHSLLSLILVQMYIHLTWFILFIECVYTLLRACVCMRACELGVWLCVDVQQGVIYYSKNLIAPLENLGTSDFRLNMFDNILII